MGAVVAVVAVRGLVQGAGRLDTVPSLHDGSPETLFEVFLWSDGGTMGATAHLSMDDLDDLEAFLLSL